MCLFHCRGGGNAGETDCSVTAKEQQVPPEQRQRQGEGLGCGSCPAKLLQVSLQFRKTLALDHFLPIPQFLRVGFMYTRLAWNSLCS